MLGLDELVAALGYRNSSRYYTQVTDFEPETAHLFRAAQEIGVVGAYVIQTSSRQNQILPTQPIVYVADVQTKDEQSLQARVRKIHRGLWNLCFAPFIILKLPHQIRVYTGFNYSENDEYVGLLESVETNQLPMLIEKLSAKAIDTGQVWTAYAEPLQANRRVDKHLLANLKKLGKLLKQDGLLPETAHALIGKYVFLAIYEKETSFQTNGWRNRTLAPNQFSPVRPPVPLLNDLSKPCAILTARFFRSILLMKPYKISISHGLPLFLRGTSHQRMMQKFGSCIWTLRLMIFAISLWKHYRLFTSNF